MYIEDYQSGANSDSSCYTLFQGVAEVTSDNEDTLQISDIARDSPEDDGETSDDDERDTSCQLKSILVYPSNTDDRDKNIVLPLKSERKTCFDLDDNEFRALTKENTMRNRASITPSLISSEVRMFYIYNHIHYVIIVG